MTVLSITCDNCGARYKLPPTFKGAQAKCQKCGSVIDVAAQRAAAEGADGEPAETRPAAARPAKARPAVDRSKSTGAGSRRRAAAADDKPARSGRTRRGRAETDEDGDDAPRSRRGREAKKKDNTPLILGGVGLLAIIVVVVVFMMNDGDNNKQKQQQAQNNEQPAKDDNTGTADPQAKTDGNQDTGDPTKTAEGDSGDGTAPAPAGGTAETPTATPTPAAAKASGRLFPDLPKEKRRPWMNIKNPPATMADVRPASERYGEVQWPASIDEAKRAEIREIVADIEVDGGLRTIRAKRKLVEEGYPALFGIVEKLRTLNYGNVDDAGLGFELNKLMEEIIVDMNARYEPVQANEEIHPAKAEWNTRTVGAWMKVLARWPDEATFNEQRAERIRKKNS